MKKKIGKYISRHSRVGGNQKHFKKTFCISFVLLFLTNCTCSGGRNRTDFELFHDMLKQKNIKAQEGDKDGTFMRVPPENTRARNKKYYPYKNKPEEAGQKLKNPFSDQFSAEVIGIGKRQYERACIYCHGATGGGEGKVAQKMTVKPPSLLTDKAIQYSDGRLYHIIHEGQGLMGAYRKQVRGEKERWALVNYVRMLQKRKFSGSKNIVPDPIESSTPDAVSEKAVESKEDGMPAKEPTPEKDTDSQKSAEPKEEAKPKEETKPKEEAKPKEEIKSGATKFKNQFLVNVIPDLIRNPEKVSCIYWIPAFAGMTDQFEIQK